MTMLVMVMMMTTFSFSHRCIDSEFVGSHRLQKTHAAGFLEYLLHAPLRGTSSKLFCLTATFFKTSFKMGGVCLVANFTIPPGTYLRTRINPSGLSLSLSLSLCLSLSLSLLSYLSPSLPLTPFPNNHNDNYDDDDGEDDDVGGDDDDDDYDLLLV